MKSNLPQNPIFIVGYPRSGTTLLQALIGSQGEVLCIPETHYFSAMNFVTQQRQNVNLTTPQIERIIDRIEEKGHLSFSKESVLEIFGNDGITTVTSKSLFEVFIEKLVDESTSDQPYRWLEKTPAHTLYIDVIHEWYPNAQFIAIVRNPLNAIASWLEHFPPVAQNKVDYLSKMWGKYMDCLEQFSKRQPSSIRMIRYEDLVQTPEIIISRLCRFLDISFDEKDLFQFSKTAKKVIMPFETWKQGVLVESINAKTVPVLDRLRKKQVYKIQAILNSRMKTYGYIRELGGFHRIFEYVYRYSNF